jgi:UPF0271 protein
VQIARDGYVTAYSGERVPLQADTLCLHGDNPEAVEIAQAIRRELAQAGVEVVSLADLPPR